MKRIFYTIAFLMAGFGVTIAQDLTPKSVSFNYDFQTALISNLEVEVENLDNFSVLDDYRIQVFVDGIGTVSCLGVDYTTDWFNDGSVPANGTLVYSLPNIDLDNLDNSCGLPTGNYHLRVVVDVDDDVSEDDENNNETAFTNDGFAFESLVSVEPADQLADIKIFPNPVQNSFYIQRGEFTGDLQVEILSMDGRIVASEEMLLGQVKQAFDVENYPSGVYLVRIQGEEQQRTEKIIVQ